MEDSIQGTFKQVITALVGGATATFIGMSLPQPFQAFLLVASALWLMTLFWMYQIPSHDSLLKEMRYLDELHKSEDKRIDDGEYYRRMNRLLILDAISARPRVRNANVAVSSASSHENTSGGRSLPKDRLKKALCLLVLAAVLSMLLGCFGALCAARVLSIAMDTKVVLKAICVAIIICDIYASNTLFDDLLDTVSGLFALEAVTSGTTFVIVSSFYGHYPIWILFICYIAAILCLNAVEYIKIRAIIEKSTRYALEIGSLISAMAFFASGVLVCKGVQLNELDFANFAPTYIVLIVAIAGGISLWMSRILWDLSLDVAIAHRLNDACSRLMIDQIDAMSCEAQSVRSTIKGLILNVALFAFVIGICIAVAF